MRHAKTTTFSCRFPGCEHIDSAPQARGRHESREHGMRKGEMLQKSDPATPFFQPFQPAPPPDAPPPHRQQIEIALEQLDRKRAVLLEALAVIRSLEPEA